MKKYTLEDVEYIRNRAYCTYDEVIGMLDAYEGDVPRVLAELERQGKLKSKSAAQQENSLWETIKGWLRSGYEHRVVVRKRDMVIINLSILFIIICLLLAPHVVIPAALILLILGYKVNFRRERGAGQEFDNFAYTAKENIRNAGHIFTDSKTERQAPPQPQPQPQAQPQPRPADEGAIIIE